MTSWIDKLTDEQRLSAYHEWQEAKRDMGDEPTLAFDEWLQMELDLAYLCDY